MRRRRQQKSGDDKRWRRDFVRRQRRKGSGSSRSSGNWKSNGRRRGNISYRSVVCNKAVSNSGNNWPFMITKSSIVLWSHTSEDNVKLIR